MKRSNILLLSLLTLLLPIFLYANDFETVETIIRIIPLKENLVR